MYSNGHPHVLHIEDACKAYNHKVILDNVDLMISAGELCTMVGPSGCGKSTLFRLILGQEKPTSGIVMVNNEPVKEPGPTVGIVYQQYALFPNMSVLDNVLLGRKLGCGFLGQYTQREQIKGEYRDEAMAFLEKVKLAEHWDKKPHQMSGGQQQRLAIAQALIKKPKLLLMDEPFGALDIGTRQAMQTFLLQLWEEYKMTIIFVTHDPDEAVFLGTRIVVLSQYYTDARGDKCSDRGARIVADYKLPRVASSTAVKETSEFGSMFQLIVKEAQQPDHRRRVEEFDLRHPDSFQTLRDEEKSHN